MPLSTGKLSEHFGVGFTSDFIVNTLGVPNTGKDKRAFLWDESLVPVIGKALADRTMRLANAPATAAQIPAPDDDNLFG